MPPILQSNLPFAAWMDPRTSRLPGIIPVAANDWLRTDDAFAGQMAERDRLITVAPGAVHALLPDAHAAADELFDRVIVRIGQTAGYTVLRDQVMRPDGVTVLVNRDQPLLTLGRLVQEDLCLLQKRGTEHVLTGAILCFPASWTLAQKIGRPMTAIHVPVAPYTDDMARRVQRLFDAIRPEQPLCRYNALVYDDPTLHQPRREGEHRPRPKQRLYLRSERQCLLRLEQSDAVLFSIHTHVVHLDNLLPADRAALQEMGL